MAWVLDSGAMTALARRPQRMAAFVRALRSDGSWPPVVSPAVLVECLTGQGGRDALVNRLLKTCLIPEHFPEALGRRAAALRAAARRGSAVDAIVVALAEPDGTVLTSDPDDLGALAAHAQDVAVERV
ncbi:MAG TPA: hypothetical protein VGQ83_28255 [Polyangia bacterium]